MLEIKKQNFYKMKKVLITGGAGYIGSKLVTKLLELDFKVTVVDVLKFSNRALNHLFDNKTSHLPVYMIKIYVDHQQLGI